MPIRKLPLVNEQIYHIFNRGITFQPVFIDRRDYKRGINLMKYYSVADPSTRYSQFMLLSVPDQEIVLSEIENKEKLIQILCYCLMPNHFHFLLRQLVDSGIEEFIRKFEISYTRYFNVKRNRKGPIFQGQFKNVLVENDSQVMHVSRYVHLNPYTSHLVNDNDSLQNYEWSSLQSYLRNKKNGLVNSEFVLKMFKDSGDYGKFVFNHADYQRKLKSIRHLIFE